MEKFGLLKTVYMILVIDEAPAIDSPAQTLTTLHNFAVGNESAYPAAGLVQGANGNLYGTTSSTGTFFKIALRGANHTANC